MSFTQEEAQRILDWLEEKWGSERKCPVCKHDDWGYADEVFEMREYHGGDFHVGGVPILPLVVATCNNCGHTLLFNAKVMGLLQMRQRRETNG